jgi:hypothetical protein
MFRSFKALARLALAGAAIIAPLTGAFASPRIFPTGVTVYDPQKAYNSYVLFGAPDGKAHLIDMDGNEVHQWSKAGFPTEALDPAITGGERGRLLVQLSNGASPYGGIFANKTIGELDWNGKVVWSWGEQAPGGEARQNHDWERLPNGDTLVVATLDRVLRRFSAQPISDQAIYEVTPDGKIVWTWIVSDHIDEFGLSPEGLNLLKSVLADGFKGHGFLTVNDMQSIGPNKWFDAGDARFAPDNIVIDSREASFIAIIDKKTGKIVWRLGPDYPTNSSPQIRPVFSQVTPRPVDQTSGQHDAHIIPKGLPGGGDLLVFDNEGPSGYPLTRLGVNNGSRVLEINPVTKQIVWQYSGLDSDRTSWSFYSSFISSARRLPNGNTLIDEGQNGRFFQVTPAGEIVWEYVNPYFGRQSLAEGREVLTNWVFRAQPVPYAWAPPGLPHEERPVKEPDVTQFHVPQS